ncbi:hypothetical protein dqs_2285 [Azoarcus olearius]|uniref:DUF481 domain-containing protein n=1 Tax=Azoarcus sp. (strain BH72) TaxID=418699 RepID=UPI0008063AD5|nr:DUF481 domain-containing protein [Azoarcus olearius]ANQ85316.1 hypothetical protein dqs_2285 [Azoarcus olearius]
MNSLTVHRTCTFLAAALPLATCALADEVLLTNGDRLTGTVVNKTPEGLVLDTKYAGKIKIDWRMVETLNTEKPVRVLLRNDEGQLESRLLSATEIGATRLAAVPEVPAVKLERIAYLNPTASQSGAGVEYAGRVTLSGGSNSGNSNTTHIVGEAELRGAEKGARFALRFRGEHRTRDGDLSASNWLGTAERNWFTDAREKRFVYARTFAERDPFRDLSLRAAVGGGYGVQLIENDSTGLSLKGGLDLVREHRIENKDVTFPALGWGVVFRHWLIGRKAEVFHEQDGYVNIEDARDITWRSRTGLRLPIVDRLTAQVQGIVQWDGQPLNGRKTTDISLQFGLGYEW